MVFIAFTCCLKCFVIRNIHIVLQESAHRTRELLLAKVFWMAFKAAIQKVTSDK